MKNEILENLKSLDKRLTGDRPERMNIAHRLCSFYERMKSSLKNHESGLLDDQIFLPGDMRWRQKFIGYHMGRILVDLGILSPEQLAGALKSQRELQERGERISLGVLSVKKGHITSREYLDALSRYFGAPIIYLLKLIPSPKIQALLADRYLLYHTLPILEDYGTAVSRTLAEPHPLILEELQKTLKIYLWRLHPDGQNSTVGTGRR